MCTRVAPCQPRTPPLSPRWRFFELLLRYDVRRPAHALAQYLQYRSLFRRAGISLAGCEVSRGVNIILVLDRQRQVVCRCALNAMGSAGIHNNHRFLGRAGPLRVPRSLALHDLGAATLGVETLIAGNSLNAHTVSDAQGAAVIGELVPFYRTNVCVQRFEFGSWIDRYDFLLPYFPTPWVRRIGQLKKAMLPRSAGGTHDVSNAWIHGDLTYRNVLQQDGRSAFIDFDRSEMSFPEFDVLLFYVDLMTHRTAEVTYEAFFDHLLALAAGRLAIRELDAFYKTAPEFALNRAVAGDIALLLLFRMLIFVLHSRRSREKLPLALLEKVLDEIA